MKRNILKFATMLFLAVVIFYNQAQAQAVFFNNKISVEAYLKSGGAGLNGNYPMQFQVTKNGANVWCQTGMTVTVTSGIFNQVLTGNSNCLALVNPMSPVVFAHTANTDAFQLTVLVDVGAGLGAGAATFSGIDFVSTPMALVANQANTATTATNASVLTTAGTSGQFLKSDGTNWTSQPITSSDVSGLGTAATGSFAAPGAIGGTTASSGAFTTLSASSTVSGAGFSSYLASPPAIGGTAAAAGAFTSLSASSTVSGTGFSTYLASPPAIGGTAAAAGSFTTVSGSTSVTSPLVQAASGTALTVGNAAGTGGTTVQAGASGALVVGAVNNSTTIGSVTNVANSTLLVAGSTGGVKINGGTAITRPVVYCSFSSTSATSTAGACAGVTAAHNCACSLNVANTTATVFPVVAVPGVNIVTITWSATTGGVAGKTACYCF